MLSLTVPQPQLQVADAFEALGSAQFLFFLTIRDSSMLQIVKVEQLNGFLRYCISYENLKDERE